MKSSSDITLLLASDGREWGGYIRDKLSEFPHISYTTIDLVPSDLQPEGPTELKSACRQSSVLLLVATHGLLDYMQKKAGWFAPTLQELSSTCSVVVLLRLDREHLDDVTQNYGYVTREWTYKDASDSCTEVQQRIAEVLDIMDYKGQTKSGRMPVFSPRAGSATPAVELFPSTVYEENTRVAIVFKKEVLGEVTLKLAQMDSLMTAVRETATVFTFTAPPKPPGKYSVLVYVDSKRQRGRPELTFRGPGMESLTSPHYLAQILRLNSVEDLDLRLKDLFNDSLPADQALDVLFRHLPDLDLSDRQKNANTRYPTLLHYAAAFGLSEFCAALLDCPGSSRAFCLRNCDGLDPAELAAEHSFYDLEDYILDFMEFHEAASGTDPHYIKMNPSPAMNEDQEDIYANPLQFYPFDYAENSQSWIHHDQQPPALTPRPEKLTASLPQTLSSVDWTSESNMPVERSSAPSADRAPVPPPRASRRTQSAKLVSPVHAQTGTREGEQQQKACTLPREVKVDPSSCGTVDSTCQDTELPAGALGSRSQGDLIQVQELVKSRHINQQQAQTLFQGWQKRYGRNTATSFKDRQAALLKIKSEYKERSAELKKRSPSGAAESKAHGLWTRFLFGIRQRKAASIKLDISEPMVGPTARKTPWVYSRAASDSQLLVKDIDRDSAISVASSTGDSGCSQRRHLSTVSSFGDAEAEVTDDVFGQEGDIRRPEHHGDISSMKPQSSGNLFLQEDMGDTSGEASSPSSLPCLNLPPIPIPGRKNNRCSDPDDDSVVLEKTYF